MKRFIVRSSLFIFSVTAALCVLLFFCQDMYWEKRVPYIKRRILDNVQSDTISIVLGSSHAMHGINSRLISDKCYNMASVSQGLEEDYFLLKHIGQKYTINKVLITLSYFSNHYSLQKLDMDGEQVRIFDYEHSYSMNYKRDIDYVRNKFNLFSRIARNVISVANSELEYDSYGNVDEECDDKVYNINTESIEGVFSRHGTNANFSKVNSYIDSIISYSDKNGIQLYWVLLPHAKEYMRYVSMTKFNSFLTHLSQSRKMNIIDIRDIFDSVVEKKMFYDPDHLSSCGRDICSRKISSIISADTTDKAVGPLGI